MRTFFDIDALPVFRSPVVTVGSFDGVHRGHRHLLGIMRDRAGETGGETVVVTFADHPRRVLDKKDDVKLLTSTEEKAMLIEKEGVDNLVVLPFDKAMSALSPEDFIRRIVVGKLGAKELVVGYNHRFGAGRAGDAKTLKGLESTYGFRIVEASQFAPDGEKISSTEIRRAIERGDTKTAERLLGRKMLSLRNL